MNISKIKKDPRSSFAKWYFIIAIILMPFSLVLIFCIKNEYSNLLAKYLWCLAFTMFGFRLLVLKICINDIHDLDDEKEVTTKEVTTKEVTIKEVTTKEVITKEVTVKSEKEVDQIKDEKIRLRYCYFYPILILFLAALSATISINQFKCEENQYFLIASALLSFFLGFFIDSIMNVIEKVGKFLS